MTMARGRIRVLDFEPDLGVALDRDRFERARLCCTADFSVPDRRSWPPSRVAGEGADDFGFLVLRGAVLQRLRMAGRETVDLFGPGDVVRPWGPLDDFAELLNPSRWHLLDRVELAVLDRTFLEQVSSWPEIIAALGDRAARHISSLLSRLAVAQIPRVETRLHVVLWDLADRFGRVRPDGVLLPLPLRHAVLAALVSTTREAASRGVAALHTHGTVVRDPQGWLLREGPPPEVFAVAAECRAVADV